MEAEIIQDTKASLVTTFLTIKGKNGSRDHTGYEDDTHLLYTLE